MPDSRFIDKKRRDKKEQKTWLCRLGQHLAYPGQIAVRYGDHQGLCGACIVRQTQRHARDTVHVPSYWTRDWPAATVGEVGPRRTWAQSPKGGQRADH